MTIKIEITECPDEIDCHLFKVYKKNTTYSITFGFLSYEGSYIDKEVRFNIDDWEIKYFIPKLKKAIEKLERLSHG